MSSCKQITIAHVIRLWPAGCKTVYLVKSEHPKQTTTTPGPDELEDVFELTPDVTTVGGLHRDLVHRLSLREGDGHLLFLR